MAKNIRHNVPTAGMGQPTFETCWYASYKMLFTYLNWDVSTIEPKLKAAGIDVKDAKDKGLLDTKYKTCADAFHLRAWPGAPFNKKQGFFDVGLSDGAEAFLKELEIGPLWVSRIADTSSYHIVVAVGYDASSERIIYNNPFPGPNNALQPELKANLFVRTITAAMGSVQGWRYAVGE
jgi:hypothetical protein